MRILSGQLELVIDDATAYWLEDVSGARLSEESTRTKAPFARALELHRAGRDPDTMRLVARLETGERYELEGGVILIDLAEASAGIPARPRQPLPAAVEVEGERSERAEYQLRYLRTLAERGDPAVLLSNDMWR